MAKWLERVSLIDDEPADVGYFMSGLARHCQFLLTGIERRFWMTLIASRL